MPTAYSYRRFSHPEQAKGRSKDRQWEKCEKYCQDNGLDLATGIDYTFLDSGKSAFHGEQLDEVNGQLARFLKLVENKSIAPGSYLIVESLDRLGRDKVKDALRRFMDLLAAGINIVTLTDQRVYREDYTEIDLMLSILIMSRAHEESATKAMRVGDAFRKKQQNARTHNSPMGKAVPLWLALENNSYVVQEDRAATVKRIFEMCIAGYGRAATAKALNADGVPSFKSAEARASVGLTKRVIGNDGEEVIRTPFDRYMNTTWATSSVDKVLHNRAVLGEYQPYSRQGGLRIAKPVGETIKDYYPRIITDAMFYQAQDAIDKRWLFKSTKQSKNFNVWLGIAKCGLCMGAMHLVDKGTKSRTSKYLHCYAARKGTCKAKSVRLVDSEAVFREMLSRLDSMALVQDNAIKIAADLSETAARLSEQRAMHVQYKAAMKTRFTEALNDIVFDCEQEIARLGAEEVRLQKALANEKITNKRDFLANVDLVTYEGRSRANTLVKRLDVQVYIGKGYFVTERGECVLCLAYRNEEVGCLVLDEAGKYNGDGDTLSQQLIDMMDDDKHFINL